MNVIETQRACWQFRTLDTLSFELIVGYVNAVRTRLVTNEDESVAVVCCEESLPVRAPLQCSAVRKGFQYAPVWCPVVPPRCLSVSPGACERPLSKLLHETISAVVRWQHHGLRQYQQDVTRATGGNTGQLNVHRYIEELLEPVVTLRNKPRQRIRLHW